MHALIVDTDLLNAADLADAMAIEGHTVAGIVVTRDDAVQQIEQNPPMS